MSTIRVGDLDIHYELADYTPPWRERPPETFLLYHGYARNLELLATPHEEHVIAAVKKVMYAS